MPRKYCAEFKDKAAYQIIEMVHLEPCAHCTALTRRSASFVEYLIIRCGLGTVTAP